MQHKRQFQTAAQRRTFYDRKILHPGYSRTINMGRIIPKTWQYVRLEVLEKTDRTITLTITKLYGEGKDAPDTQTNKRNRQNP